MATTEHKKTGLVRASYARDMFEAQEGTDDNGNKTGVKKFGGTLLVPKTDAETVKMLEGLVIEACVAEGWGDEAKIREMIANELIKMPVLNGDGPQGVNKTTGERHPGYAGHFFVRTTSGEDFPPKIVDEKTNPILTFDPTRLKSGDYGYAAVNAYSWVHKKTGRKGVSIGLGAFQKIKAGDSLGGSGGVDANKFFQPEKVEGEAAPDETKGGAGAAGMFG